jgi:hypothetical protein
VKAGLVEFYKLANWNEATLQVGIGAVELQNIS